MTLKVGDKHTWFFAKDLGKGHIVLNAYEGVVQEVADYSRSKPITLRIVFRQSPITVMENDEGAFELDYKPGQEPIWPIHENVIAVADSKEELASLVRNYLDKKTQSFNTQLEQLMSGEIEKNDAMARVEKEAWDALSDKERIELNLRTFWGHDKKDKGPDKNSEDNQKPWFADLEPPPVTPSPRTPRI